MLRNAECRVYDLGKSLRGWFLCWTADHPEYTQPTKTKKKLATIIYHLQFFAFNYPILSNIAMIHSQFSILLAFELAFEYNPLATSLVPLALQVKKTEVVNNCEKLGRHKNSMKQSLNWIMVCLHQVNKPWQTQPPLVEVTPRGRHRHRDRIGLVGPRQKHLAAETWLAVSQIEHDIQIISSLNCQLESPPSEWLPPALLNHRGLGNNHLWCANRNLKSPAIILDSSRNL